MTVIGFLLLATGLSPRVRGHRQVGQHRRGSLGSIPACAGAPWAVCRLMNWPTVYPRVCGGTCQCSCAPRSYQGLSPRVRGHLFRCAAWRVGVRSIPACAGAPGGGVLNVRHHTVYPRVCGGTRGKLATVGVTRGLSPRVRGHRQRNTLDREGVRSIPACAGAPVSPAALMGLSIPACAGAPLAGLTSGVRGHQGRDSGGTLYLSPRVRGHLMRPASRYPGSIPACAGAPPWGLSSVGSIPACAGAPVPTKPGQVYPRVCGGTARVCVRSNDSGSIPACAGAP